MIQPLGHPSPTPLTTLTLSPLSHPLTLFQPHLFLCYSLNTPNTLLFQSLRPSITALPRISTPSIQNFVSICLIFFFLSFIIMKCALYFIYLCCLLLYCGPRERWWLRPEWEWEIFKINFGVHTYRTWCRDECEIERWREIQDDALGFDLSNWVDAGVILWGTNIY